MVYRGTIKSGRVILPSDVTLPEGAEVLVSLPDEPPGPAAGSGIWQKLTELGQWAETLPTDLMPYPAANPAPSGRSSLGTGRTGRGAAEPSRRGFPLTDRVCLER